MYCHHCGNQISDESLFCSKCGNQINKMPTAVKGENQPHGNKSTNQKQRGLKNTIITFSCVSIFFTWVFIIPTLWKIPMIATLYQRFKNDEEISVAFNICYFLFVGIISGFLLFFVKNPNRNAKSLENRNN